MPMHPVKRLQRLLGMTALAVALTACPEDATSYSTLGGVPNEPRQIWSTCPVQDTGKDATCMLLSAANGCLFYEAVPRTDIHDPKADCRLIECSATVTPPGCTRNNGAPPPDPFVAWSRRQQASAAAARGDLLAQATTSIPGAERAALLAFYDALAGDSWRNKDAWKGAVGTECSWYGVTCNAAGTAVIGIEMRANDLDGSLPASLGNFPKLERLALLAESDVKGSLPPQLGNLASLKILRLVGLGVTGPLPPQVANLTHLELLQLNSLALSGPLPAGLFDLSSLRNLEIVEVPLTGTLAGIGGLGNLEVLNLSATAISGGVSAELGDLDHLRALTLAFNQLTGPLPATLGNLGSLIGLHIVGNKLSGGLPASLGSLTNRAVRARLLWSVGPPTGQPGQPDQAPDPDLSAGRFTGPLPSLAGMHAHRPVDGQRHAGHSVPRRGSGPHQAPRPLPSAGVPASPARCPISRRSPSSSRCRSPTTPSRPGRFRPGRPSCRSSRP